MADQTLAEQLANRLRRDILRGKLQPGASVKERDNATELGVSRTPMREAIRILAKEGLISLRPSRSPIVAVSDYQDVADQTVVLIALETLSGELACKHATAADLEKLQQIMAHMDAHFDTSDPLDMFEIDMSFHTAIAQASHNQALVETHSTFLRRLWRARYLSAVQRRNRERVVGHHTQILNALLARDPAAVRKAIDTHLHNLAEDIRTVLEQENQTNSNESTEVE